MSILKKMTKLNSKFKWRDNFIISTFRKQIFYFYFCIRYYFMNRRKNVEGIYKMYTDKVLNLDNPETFNDKLNWLKIYWYDPIAYKCVDKYRVREVVKERGYENLLNTLYAVYDNPKDINWDELPKEFILKANNGCGNHVICKDKEKLDKKEAIKTLKKSFYKNYAVFSAEWPYEKVKPKIICEKLLDENGKLPIDYKFFCSNGKPLFLVYAYDRDKDTKFVYLDLDFKRIPTRRDYQNTDIDEKDIIKPDNFNEMIKIAGELSKGLPFVRVDFYNINGKIIFGEYTFFPNGGRHDFIPDKYNYIFGNMIELPPKMKTPFIKE